MYKSEKLLNCAYEDEVELTDDGKTVILKKINLGDLYLSTGEIVANDPFVCFETEPFSLSVKPGHYPVSISVAHFEDFVMDNETHTGDRRVALAMLKFSDKKPVRWEMAVTAQQLPMPDELKDDGFFGYGVDSGTGGFMDKTVADRIAADEAANIYDKFEEAFDASYVHTYSFLLASAFDSEHKDFACFSSGYGDGAYPSYFGFDEAGEPCALVTDFLLFDDPL